MTNDQKKEMESNYETRSHDHGRRGGDSRRGAGGLPHSGAVRTGNGAVAATSESNTKVVVDGKDQTVKGSVACTTAAGNVSIAIGGATAGASGAPPASALCSPMPTHRSSNPLRSAMSTV